MLRGFYLRFGDTLDEGVNEQVHALTRAVLLTPHPALTDVIPGYTTVYLEYDATRTDEGKLRRWLETLPTDTVHTTPRTVRVPVTYDGPDLEEVATNTGLTPAEVVRRHSTARYRVFALGFTPGLAFMGTLEPALHQPRRSSPREHVEPGTVAIANAQTTIYPVTSPGGWNLIGRAHSQIYDPLRPEPLLFSAGDNVLFVPSEAEPPEQAEHTLELLPLEPHIPFLKVVEAGLLDIVVDGGRFWSGRFGLARGGALDAPEAARANRLVGNPPGAALLELNLKGGVFEACASGVVAVCGGLQAVFNGERMAPDSSFILRSNDRLSFAPTTHGSRAYLALAGSLEVTHFRNSASTDLRGRIGRPLREGDVLGVAAQREVRAGRAFQPFRQPDLPLRLLPGPQASSEALEALTRQTFRLGRADRMGLHLDGGVVPGGEVISEAVPLGSVQVPASGEPMILLNDRGTLGGYSKPAIVHPRDLPRVGQLRPGERIRFRLETKA